MDMNYYAMLDVACDIPDADQVKEIKMKLPAWYSAQQTAFNNATDGITKKKLQQELDEYPNMQKLLTDTALRKKHADALKTELLRQVQFIIDIITECNNSQKSITSRRIKNIAAKIGLKEVTVKKQFRDAGYTVVDVKNAGTGDVFLNETPIRSIEGALEAVRRYAQSDRCYDEIAKEAAKATDLYEYLAVMEGHTVAEGASYRLKPVENLRQICSNLATTHNGNASPIKDYQTLDSTGKMQVFASEKTRNQYNNSLRLAAIKSSFLDKLISVPDSLRQDRSFAEACISRIQQEFPDEDDAIAIYNKYAQLSGDDAYEKESVQKVTVCASCHVLNYHNTIEEARTAKCTNCGQALYEICPSCGKYSPVIAESCSCGFFKRGAQSFEQFYTQFNTCIDNYNLAGADENYAYAVAANPSEKRLTTMKSKLEKLREEIGKPIKEIDSLIRSGKIYAAETKVQELKRRFKGVDLTAQEKAISAEKAWAEAEYKRHMSAPEGTKLEAYTQINNRVKDYIPVQEWLRIHKPHAVLSVQGTTDPGRCCHVIQWKDDPNNRFVTYTVVRKENARPQNTQDGVILATGLKATVYRDDTLKPGRTYYYAVFALRGDASSEPAWENGYAVIYKDLDNVQVQVMQGKCILSWTDIEGSIGVQITRKELPSGEEKKVSNCSKNAFTDTDVRDNVEYRYKLVTIWRNKDKYAGSAGITKTVRIEQRPSRIDLALVSVGDDGYCTVSWDPKVRANGNEVIKIIRLNDRRQVIPDQLYPMTELKAVGTELNQGVILAGGKHSWYEKEAHIFKVAAFRPYGDSFVAGRPITISTVPAPVIDNEKTVVNNNLLKVHLKDIPAAVKRVCYTVSSTGEVMNEAVAMRNGTAYAEAAAVRATNEITSTNVPEGTLTVSVMYIYGEGDARYPSPITTVSVSNLPRARISYDISWPSAIFGGKKRAGAVLKVVCDSASMPELVLCARTDGKLPIRYIPGSTEMVELARIEPGPCTPGREKTVFLSEERMNRIPRDAYIKLFPAPKYKDKCEPLIQTEASNCRMPK